MMKKGRTPSRYTMPCMFGLTYVNDSSYDDDDDADVYDEFQSILLPH